MYSLSPEAILAYIGVENAYLLIGILAFLGGVTTFSGIPYHLVLVTLAAGGLNPLLLGGITGVAVMMGDATSYFVGVGGKHLVPTWIEAYIEQVLKLCRRHPTLTPVVFFLYGALVPFSNDVITIPMGAAGYPFWRVMGPLALGNLVFNITLAYLAVSASGLLSGWL